MAFPDDLKQAKQKREQAIVDQEERRRLFRRKLGELTPLVEQCLQELGDSRYGRTLGLVKRYIITHNCSDTFGSWSLSPKDYRFGIPGITVSFNYTSMDRFSVTLNSESNTTYTDDLSMASLERALARFG